MQLCREHNTNILRRAPTETNIVFSYGCVLSKDLGFVVDGNAREGAGDEAAAVCTVFLMIKFSRAMNCSWRNASPTTTMGHKANRKNNPTEFL